MKLAKIARSKVVAILLIAILVAYNGFAAMPIGLAEMTDGSEQLTPSDEQLDPNITESTNVGTSDEESNPKSTPNETVTGGQPEGKDESKDLLEQPPVETITVETGRAENGTITLSHSGEVEKSTEVTVTVTPNPGYYIDSFQIGDNKIVDSIDGTKNQLKDQQSRSAKKVQTFTANQDVTITAKFAKVKPVVTFKETNTYQVVLPEDVICEDHKCFAPITVQLKASDSNYFKDEHGKLVQSLEKVYEVEEEVLEPTVEGIKVGVAVKANSDLEILELTETEVIVEKEKSFEFKLKVEETKTDKQFAGIIVQHASKSKEPAEQSEQQNEAASTPEALDVSASLEQDSNQPVVEKTCLVPTTISELETRYDFQDCPEPKASKGTLSFDVELTENNVYKVTANNVTEDMKFLFFSEENKKIDINDVTLTADDNKNYVGQVNDYINIRVVNAHNVDGQNIYLSKDGYVELSFNEQYSEFMYFLDKKPFAKTKIIKADEISNEEVYNLIDFTIFKKFEFSKVVLPNKGFKIYKDVTEPSIGDVTIKASIENEKANGYVKGVERFTFKVNDDANSNYKSGVATVTVDGSTEGVSKDGDTYKFKIPEADANTSKTYTIKVTDFAGNTSTEEVEVKADTTAPTLNGKIEFKVKQTEEGTVKKFLHSFVNLMKYGSFVPDVFKMSIPATDTESGVDFENTQILDEKGKNLVVDISEDGYYDVKMTTDLEDGSTPFKVVLVDNLGNESTEIAVNKSNSNMLAEDEQFTVDVVNPKLNVEYVVEEETKTLSNDGVDYFSKLNEIKLQASDLGAGVETIHYEIKEHVSKKLLHEDTVTFDLEEQHNAITKPEIEDTKELPSIDGELTEGAVEETNDATEPKVDVIADTEETVIVTDNTKKVDTTITLPTNIQNEKVDITFTVRDAVGNTTKVTKTFAIDTEAPTVTSAQVYDAETNNETAVYANDELTFTVTPNDYLVGIESVKLMFGDTELASKEEDGIYTFTLDEDSFKGSLTLVMIDKFGAIYEKTLNNENSNLENPTGTIIIDQVKPTIAFTSMEPQYVDGDKKFYKDHTLVNVQVTDAVGLNQWTAEVNDSIVVEYKVEEERFKTSDASSTDNVYTYKVKAFDLAGNTKEATYTVYVDQTAPEISNFKYSVKKGEVIEDIYDSKKVEVVENEKLDSYYYYFKEDVKVTIQATDDKNDSQEESGVKAIAATLIDYSKAKHYVVLANGDLEEIKADQVVHPVAAVDGAITVNIPKSFKGAIFATPVDNVGNIGAKASQDGTIHETSEDHVLAEHITIDKPDTSYVTADGKALYEKAIDVNAVVTDLHSGIEKIEWSLTSDYETAKNVSGTLKIDNNGEVTGAGELWSIESKDKNLITKMKAKFPVNINGQVTLKLKLTDRTGHVSEEEVQFAIDTTKPQILGVKVKSKYKNKEKALYKDVTRLVIDAQDNASDVFNSGVESVNVTYKDKNDAEVVTTAALDVETNKFVFDVPAQLANETMSYTIEAIDRAKNSVKHTEIVKVDITAPIINLENGQKVQIRALESAMPNIVQSVINFITLGSFTPDRFEITIPAIDPDNGSGVNLDETKLVLSNGTELDIDAKGNNVFVVAGNPNQVINTTFSVVLTDNFGNESEPYLINNSNSTMISSTNDGVVTIDAVAPTLNITNSRSPEYVNENIEYFQGSHTFNYSVLDEDARIWEYDYRLNTDINGTSYELDSDVKTASADVTIPTELLNMPVNIALNATDRVGNTSTTSKTVFVDSLLPSVSNIVVSGGVNNIESGLFTNQKVTIAVTVDDAGSGMNTVTLLANEEELPLVDRTDSTYTFELDKASFDSTVTLIATDNVGNTLEELISKANSNLASESGRIVIDKEAPQLEISTGDVLPVYTTGDRNFYNEDVDVIFDTKDNKGIDYSKLNFNKEEPVIFNKNGALEDVQVINTSVYKVTDNVYVYDVTVLDLAGNSTQKQFTIYVDQTAPIVTSFEYAVKKGDKYVGKTEDLDPEVIEELESYFYFFKEDVQVTVTATDDLNDSQEESGVKAIAAMLIDYADPKKTQRYEVLPNGNLRKLAEGQYPQPIETEKTIKINIPKNFKGAIYATPYDHATNIGDMVSPEGTINETKDFHDSELHIDIKKPKTTMKTGFGQELYNKDVPLNVRIADTHSGIERVEWSIISPYDVENNVTGTITIDNDGKMSGDTAAWKITKQDKNLVTEMKHNFTVANNSNDIKVKFKITDHSGHTSTEELIFAIDKTKPTIDVVYDLNGGDAQYEDFYMETRTATITVTERNFNKEDVVTAITNTDGTIPKLSNWSLAADSSDPDNNKYIAKVVYAADGDYTFDIDATDYANNKADNYIGDEFTIDQTVPEVAVSYSSNATAQNGMYFNKARTATIAITEHNFDASRVVVTGSGENEGSALGYPSYGGWSKNGDVYTTSITYSTDGVYTFDIDFTDMAGNVSADYSEDQFVIDLTVPEVTISGVEHQTAYNDFIQPTIEYYDTNLNTDGVNIVLNGANRGEVTSTMERTQVNNGESILIENLKKVEENDDIYTLDVTIQDLAGNETTETIQYSVNRFGSNYLLVGETQDLLNSYTNQEIDVVIHEINVDALESEAVRATVVKNGTPYTLQNEADYTVSRSATDANWSVYEYKVAKKLFKNDGKYELSLYSKDIAGNSNDSTDPSKEFSLAFVIDKTAPLLQSINLEKDTTYALDNYNAKFYTQDNFGLEEIKVLVNDKEVEFEELNSEIQFQIDQSTEAQGVIVQVIDKANNSTELALNNIFVTRNLFVRYVNNKPLLYSTTGGAAAVSVAAVGVFLFRRRV